MNPGMTQAAGMESDALTGRVIGCAIDVHRSLGPGLLESAYQKALAYDLQQAGLNVETQKAIPVRYKDIDLDCAYRADIVVEEALLLELKSVPKLEPVHEAQLQTYMRLAGIGKGLLINFNVRYLKDGIKRRVL